MTETVEQFTAGYAERSGIPVDTMQRLYVSLPCPDCDYETCTGWQSVSISYAVEAGVCVNCGRDRYRHDESDPEYKPYTG